MHTVTSRDGTSIAYERAGSGRPIIFATGAFNDHTTCAPVAKELEADHTVITYDRRARGQSGDTAPYAIEREVEDLAALVEAAGGEAAVFGFSSGGTLALRAAADGLPISHLLLFEVPFRFDAEYAGPTDLPERLADLVAQGRRGDAVALFQTEGIGLPAEMVAQIRQSPMFPALEAMAQSVVYDATLTNALVVPTAEMIAVTTPTLVLFGAGTWPLLREAALGLADRMPNGEIHELADAHDHDIPAVSTAAAIREFLAGEKGRSPY
jgi:pimeloyl-ACP methyl ester carboxylesterase